MIEVAWDRLAAMPAPDRIALLDRLGLHFRGGFREHVAILAAMAQVGRASPEACIVDELYEQYMPLHEEDSPANVLASIAYAMRSPAGVSACLADWFLFDARLLPKTVAEALKYLDLDDDAVEQWQAKFEEEAWISHAADRAADRAEE